ncbi:OsmC family protein [Flavobacterium sp. UMI-01]|uniref:OsmC family protein n=1 Tax=Flavobacterium sp. UMI-01 TaxID=1441053 RepID=UPI001C7DD024|nr:OsmC family protein [Flavobacterium sp. UMI-01]GIZ10147.1 peroxiredoxin [Flavobacterium sp. UMI-01]
MDVKHFFKARLDWFAKPKGTTRYVKNHSVTMEGKDPLRLSAAKAFKGDPTAYNPEDLLLSSVVSCHMMSYLFVCHQHGIEVISYQDEAQAVLEVGANYAGRITEVQLFPKVTIRQKDKIALALSLHTQANALCFIANSCNFPIVHSAICDYEE